MPILPFFNLLIYIVLSLICLILTALYLREYNRARRVGLDEAQTKSYQILGEAIKKAQALMSSSELEALKLSADTRFYKQKLENKFDSEIEKAIEQMKADLAKSQAEYSNYLAYLKEQSDQSRNQSLDAIREQVSSMFSGFEEKLTQFLGETQKNSVESIALELKATRQLIETYKSNQLKLIDENIISMLERTLSLVLIKKIGLRDQIDLVYESLEQAKTEKFIV